MIIILDSIDILKQQYTSDDLFSNMCWDEENRLGAVLNGHSLSTYLYDVGGERVWKFTGSSDLISANGEKFYDANVDNTTLYSSPYMVINDQGYTKHIYSGSQKVTTKLGGGFDGISYDVLVSTNNAISPVNDESDYRSIYFELNNQILNFAYCTHEETEVSYNIYDDYRLSILGDLVEQNIQENEIYFYHTNHLGSSSWITDALGDVNQHLQQLPYGEEFIDQRQGSFDARYQFTGKEQDQMTGYQYFGARYYNSDISVWLSVDPLADKYPSMSPYMYCAGNPVMLVDPDGNEIWIVKNRVFGKDIRYKYVPGSLYNGNDRYIGRTVTNLNKLYITDKGSQIVSNLSDSKKILDIRINRNGSLIGNAYLSRAEAAKNNNKNPTIYYNPYSYGWENEIYYRSDGLRQLSHELKHAHDDFFSQYEFWNDYQRESSAVYFENYITSVYRLGKIRTFYEVEEGSKLQFPSQEANYNDLYERINDYKEYDVLIKGGPKTLGGQNSDNTRVGIVVPDVVSERKIEYEKIYEK